MTGHCLKYILLVAVLPAAQILARAGDLIKSSVLENDVAYLRVGEVGKNLAEEVQSAQDALAATNKIVGIVLDLRFAGGDNLDSTKSMADWFAQKSLPLAILVNGETRRAAAKLATTLHESRAGLIFGNSTEVKPDIALAAKTDDEKKFLENPYGMMAPSETNSAASTNDFLPFIDHTTEADLVRAKIKDGDEDASLTPERATEPPKPFIRDPALARAVDLLKGLAIVKAARG